MITLPYLFEILNHKTVGGVLTLLLFCVLSVSAATPVNGQACWNTATGDMFQHRTDAPPRFGKFQYYNTDPIVEEDRLCYAYATNGARCYIQGTVGPGATGTWPVVVISVYECPIDDYALPLGIVFSGFICFYLRRSLSDVKVDSLHTPQ